MKSIRHPFASASKRKREEGMPDRRLRCHRKSQDRMKLGCVAGAKREKVRKRRKGKGAPAISTSVFVFHPPFSDNVNCQYVTNHK